MYIDVIYVYVMLYMLCYICTVYICTWVVLVVWEGGDRVAVSIGRSVCLMFVWVGRGGGRGAATGALPLGTSRKSSSGRPKKNNGSVPKLIYLITQTPTQRNRPGASTTPSSAWTPTTGAWRLTTAPGRRGGCTSWWCVRTCMTCVLACDFVCCM